MLSLQLSCSQLPAVATNWLLQWRKSATEAKPQVHRAVLPGGELAGPSLTKDAELLKFMKDDVTVIVPSCLL